MKSVVNGETIQFVNGYYEKKGAEITKYYYAGASQVAVRKYTVPESTTLHYMLGNHLGSASVVMDDAGTFVSETRYKPWGEVRYTTANKTLPTRYTFTGQYSHMDDSATDLGAAGFGLMFYNARWYDPMTGRFAQADTIVPGGVQGLDRYAYGLNNPSRYRDPSGHTPVCGYSYSDPECPPKKTAPLKNSTTTLGGACGHAYSDPECAALSHNQEISPPSQTLLDKVYALANGDENLINAWSLLYQTESGHELALYIVNNGIQMMWRQPGFDSGTSYSFCSSGVCWIEIALTLHPDTSSGTSQEVQNELTLALGHEAYHHMFGHPCYGDDLCNSQAEEFLAIATEYAIAVDLAEMNAIEFAKIFEGYYLTDENSLGQWIIKLVPSYQSIPPYYVPQ